MGHEVHSKKGERFKAENLIRLASTNNARYIVNADRKARIIIIVNAAIISILISLTGFQVPNQILPEIPKIILLITNIICLLFALKSVESLHTAKVEDKEELKILLDYTKYVDMPFGDYLQNMKNLLADHEKVFEQAIIDLYMQGQLLQNKNRYLETAFRIFGYGMLATILTFLLIQFIL